MTARDDVLAAIDAVLADRRAAHDAGREDISNLLFTELQSPLNSQLARLNFDARSDDEKRAETLSILDTGLARASVQAPANALTNTQAFTDDLRSRTSAGAPPTPNVNPDLPTEPPAPNLDDPAPPPAGAPGPFISARKTAHLVVNYIDAAGRDVNREGGSRSWRNNNPGNIRKGDFADNHGAIGDDGAFAIFPDEKTGFAAIVSLLRTSTYGALSLSGAINRYAPPSENDSNAYLTFIVGKTGLNANDVLDDLRIADIRKIAAAIQQMEGWREGGEHPNTPASGAPVPAAAGGISSATAAAREWMQIAEREAALPARERTEWADPEENPRILDYFNVAAPWFEPGDGDETDWCAAFVNYCLLNSGYIGTNHPGARSFFWNKKKQFIKHTTPVVGSIGVRRYAPFSDATWASGKGHVGFVTSFDSTHVTLLGGNQGKTVKHQKYKLKVTNPDGSVASEFVAFMMPVMH